MDTMAQNSENLIHLIVRKRDFLEEFLAYTERLVRKTEILDVNEITHLIGKRQRLISAIERIDKRIAILGGASAFSFLPDARKGELATLFESMKATALKATELTEDCEASMNLARRYFRNELSRSGRKKEDLSPYAGAQMGASPPRFLDAKL